MAAASAVWDRNQFNNSTGKEEKLFLFGYSCKIFRDDEKASYITQGKHLIPWMGDENLWIDRYDVRGYLHDLKPYETNPGVKYEDPLAEEEKLCDEERYLALKSNLTEEQLYQEEELKRLRAAVASDGAYHEIGFTYDNETYKEPSTLPKVEDPEDDLFEIPSGLEIPKGMEVPYNMKIHAIIEKTALFICEQGGQMEIIIKMKQQSNPQFAFMHLDNPLYPYYKHLVKEIKAGHYKPIQVKKVVQSEDEDDGHYLHPSLMAGKAEDVPKFTVPSINFRRTDNDSYSVLVKNLQQQIIEDTRSNSPHYCAEPSYYSDPSSTETGNSLSHPSGAEDIDASKVVVPPPSIQPVIDKMAEYVAKNGEDFEFVVRSKKDKRFDFLIPGNEYYPYYIQKRNACKKPAPPPESTPPAKKKKKSKTASQPLQPYKTSKKVPHTIDNEPEIIICDTKGAEVACEPMSTSDPEVVYEGPSFDDSVIALDSNCQNSGQTTIENSPVFQETEQQPVSMEDLTEPVLSPKSPKSDDGKVKSLAHKVVKGPISFSLKSKDIDCQNLDKPNRLRLDDSEEEAEDQQQQAVTEPVKSKKVTSSESRTTIVSRNHSVESEEKSVTSSSENVEAKLTEEKIKERLLAGAREKRAVQKREKQLQLERKRKAALFLKMLEKEKRKEVAAESPERSPNQRESTPNQRENTPPKPDPCDLKIPGLGFSPETRSMEEELLMHVKIPGLDIYPEASDITSPKNGDLISRSATNSISSQPQSPTQPPDKHPLSSPSDTTEDELYSASPPKITSTITPEISKKHRHHKSSKKKKGKKEKKKKSIPAKYLLRTPSPPRNHKQEKVKREKEKALPAAYANIRRSRSRSRSPKRYRSEPRLPSPKRWVRRRM